jgi:crossover junction endodeoxyribonuclease RuvC
MGKIISTGDLPVAGVGAQRMISGPLYAAIIERFKPPIAIVERVGPMPRQGVSSTFKFGRRLGITEGVVGGAMIPVSYVSAAVWKQDFHLVKDRDEAGRAAIEVWPGSASLHFSQRDNSRAEAALIGLWLARTRAVVGSGKERTC